MDYRSYVLWRTVYYLFPPSHTSEGEPLRVQVLSSLLMQALISTDILKKKEAEKETETQ